MRRLLTLSLFLLVMAVSCPSFLGGQAGFSKQTDPVPTALPAPAPTTVGVLTHYTQPECVLWDNKVHLRSTPNTDIYPLGVLKSGDRVYPNGGMVGAWMEVNTPLGHGWVNANYVGTCPNGESSGLYDPAETYFR